MRRGISNFNVQSSFSKRKDSQMQNWISLKTAADNWIQLAGGGSLHLSPLVSAAYLSCASHKKRWYQTAGPFFLHQCSYPAHALHNFTFADPSSGAPLPSSLSNPFYPSCFHLPFRLISTPHSRSLILPYSNHPLGRFSFTFTRTMNEPINYLYYFSEYEQGVL